jgi:signal transduction histidine kinase
MQTTVNFKTNILLKNLVGKDLINDDSIAVVELVKNAHDALSSSVLIKFETFNDKGQTTPDSRIIVCDKGSGMDDTDLKDKWLNIAYSEKTAADHPEDFYFAGNKGIGRFSCDRLGEKLDLLTRKDGEEIFNLQVAWPDFEIQGKKDLTIQEVDVPLQTISEMDARTLSGVPMPRHGTVLVISRLRSTWDRDKLLGLKQSLGKFLSPNEVFLKRKFDIHIEAKQLEKGDKGKQYVEQVNGVVQNQVFSNLRFNSTYIQSEISPDGKTTNTELFHEGEVVFRLREKNPLKLKNTKAFIYYLNPYKKAYFKRQTGMRSIDFGSIFLFLNGFRIAPYGDRGDDWLGLDVRKTQGTTRYLGSRDLVGRVEVLDDEELFKPISSREGLKKTEEFNSLRDGFILEVVRRLEKFVVEGLDWDSIPAHLRDTVRDEQGLDWKKTSEEYTESWDKKKERIALAIMTYIGSSPEQIISFWFNPALLEDVSEQRTDEVRDLLAQIEGYDARQVEPSLKSGLARLKKIVAEKEKQTKLARAEAANLRVAVAQKDQKISKLSKESETYRAQTLFLKSIGSLEVKNLLTFHHEIVLNSNIIDNYVARVIKALRSLDKSSDALQAVEKIGLANKRILAIAQFATKANFKSSTGKESTDIPAFFEQYTLNVARDFVATGLSIDLVNSVKEPFEIKARRIELSILIDNIISNAKKAQARNLKINIFKKTPNVVVVSFQDNGRGLSDSIKDIDDIFEAGITTTSGSGLGLHHAREIVDSIGGTIKAYPAKPSGFEIRMEFTK